jgi:hypothetical protein
VILCGVLIACCGSAAYFVGVRVGRSAERQPVTTASEASAAAPVASVVLDRALQARVTMLERELAELRAGMAERTSVARPDPVPTEAAPEHPPTEEETKRPQEEWHSRMAEVEASYRAERLDQAWALATKEKLIEAWSTLPALGKNVRSVECRSETCRVEAIDDLHGDFSKDLQMLPLRLADTLPSVQADGAPQADGTVKRTFYFSRRPEVAATEPARL